MFEEVFSVINVCIRLRIIIVLYKRATMLVYTEAVHLVHFLDYLNKWDQPVTWLEVWYPFFVKGEGDQWRIQDFTIW